MTRKDLRIFAYIWALIFIVVGFYPLYKSGLPVDFLQNIGSLNIRVWAIFVASIFLITGTFTPNVLTGLYKIWMRFGELMGGVISKIILVMLFYGLFTPASIVLKLLKKDLLHKKLDKNCQSYWLKRDRQPGSLKKQF